MQVNLSGSSASTGLICSSYACGSSLFGYSLWASDGTNGSGPLTLSFAQGVSGIGTYLTSKSATGYTDFSATLSLYNGVTLLDTVAVSSSEFGDPVYIGARDTSGANITSAVFRLASIGSPYKAPTSITFGFDYDSNLLDEFWCADLTADDFASDYMNRLQCPKATANPSFGGQFMFPFAVENPNSDLIDQVLNGSYPNAAWISAYPDGYHPDTRDSDPSHLASLFVARMDLIANNDVASVPEPGSAFLILPGLGVLLLRNSRRQ